MEQKQGAKKASFSNGAKKKDYAVLHVDEGPKTGDANHRAKLLEIIMKEMVENPNKIPRKRFFRATKGDNLVKKCYLIHDDRAYDEQTPPKKVEHPYVSWCIPDFSSQEPSKKCAMQLCFDVNEVQKFIEKNTNEEGNCPMFGRSYIQKLVNEEHITIEENMPNDFRHVFTNYDVSTFSNEPLGKDFVTNAVVRFVGESIKGPVIEKQDKNVSFWKATKNLFTSAAYKGWNLVARTLKFVLTSPFWLHIVLSMVRILRIIICVMTSALGTTENMIAIVKAVSKKIRDDFPRAAFFTFLVDAAVDLLHCVFGGGFASCGTGGISALEALGSIPSLIMDIFRTFGDQIFSTIGLKWFSVSSVPLLTRSPELFRELLALDQNVTRFATIQSYMQNLSVYNFELLSIIGFLDIMMLSFGAADAFITFLLNNFCHDEEFKKNVKEAIDKAKNSKIFSFFYIFAGFARAVHTTKLIFGWIEEIFYWITDVIPCLFKYFMRLFKIVLTLGFVDFPQDDAACCMGNMIMKIRHAIGFNEAARLEKISAQEARALALDQQRQTQSENEVVALEKQKQNIDAKREEILAQEANQGFFSRIGSYFVGRGPENELQKLEDEYKKLPTTSDKATNDFNELKNQWINDMETRQFATDVLSANADTFEVVPVPEPRKKISLWIGQCSDETSRRVFENPIFVYDGKIPFYFHEIVGPASKNQKQSPWCVAPSYEALQKYYPQATWNIDGDPFVLLQHVPNELTKHMFQLETPIYQF